MNTATPAGSLSTEQIVFSEDLMPNLTISIPHQLGRAEAKRRISEQAAHLHGQHGGMLERVEQRWEGDTLHFLVAAMSQSISGTAYVGEQTVDLDIALPWMLSLLAATVKKQLEQQGHKLLEQKDKSEPRP
jgi:putative polyhydroxyalkanoate system protein